MMTFMYEVHLNKKYYREKKRDEFQFIFFMHRYNGCYVNNVFKDLKMTYFFT